MRSTDASRAIAAHLIERGGLDLNVGHPVSGETPLMVAVRHEDEKNAKALVAAAPADLNLRNAAGNTALLVRVLVG
jgi:ankyrin repeat protein